MLRDKCLFACRYPLSQYHLLKRLLFTIESHWYLCQVSVDHIHKCWFLDSEFCDIYLYIYPYASITVFSSQEVALKSREINPLIFYFCKIVLTILSSLHFHIYFRISLSIFTHTKKMIEIALNLQINLGRNAISTYWAFQFINTECLFIYSDLLSFLLVMFYCF